MKIPERLVEIISKEDRFIILSHENPEGDALGSSIALALALKGLGKDVEVFNKDGVPSIYRFLPASEIIKRFDDLNISRDSVIIILDCNSPERVGIKGKIDCRLSIVVDHHETESDYGDIRWIEPASPATGLMIYYLLKKLDVPINKEIATNLYTAISIDTGTFRYSNTTAETLLAGADLIDKGAEPSYIAERLYESWSEKRFLLLIKTLNTMEIHSVNSIKIAITNITGEMFRETGTDSSDTENFSNFPRMMEDIQISAMFREVDRDRWKASLRSKGRVNVAEIASRLGGGGHRNAAGFHIEGNLKDIKDRFLKTVADIYKNKK